MREIVQKRFCVHKVAPALALAPVTEILKLACISHQTRSYCAEKSWTFQTKLIALQR